MDFSKEEIARLTNKDHRTGSLGEVTGSDVFIGLSAGGVLTPQMVRAMALIRSSSRWPTRCLRSHPTWHGKPGPWRWLPAAPTTRTRSTTRWRSPVSSAARSTSRRAASTTR